MASDARRGVEDRNWSARAAERHQLCCPYCAATLECLVPAAPERPSLYRCTNCRATWLIGLHSGPSTPPTRGPGGPGA